MKKIPKKTKSDSASRDEYQRPTLTAFGAVKDLTAGGSKSISEGAPDPGMAEPDPAFMA